MNQFFDYQDTVTIIEVAADGYGDDKTITDQADINCVFLQNTGQIRTNNQDLIDADAVCYPDPDATFVSERSNRLEGLYILSPLFDASGESSWYKITNVTVNRDHLLGNTIDNIELALKKTRPIPGVS